jgi:outer membrane lipoprotein-sorting protein
MAWTRWLGCQVAVAFLALSAAAQTRPAAPSGSLAQILDRMDQVATDFHTTEADFVWEQYTKVVNDTDTQKGKIYFRRSGKEIQMAADVTEPDEKYVLFSNGKVQVYQPRTGQLNSYDASKNRAEVESFLVLGFGGGGHAMLKSFDVKYLGAAELNGVETANLDLVPKSEKARNTFPHIELWVDTTRGIAVQQQLFQPGGDYRMTHYSNILMNHKIPDSVFKLKDQH